MSRMRLLIVSGRTLNRVAMATCGRARRWCKTVARSRSARVRTGRRPVPGSGQAGAVAAALVQARLPLLVVQRHQRGGQGSQSWAGSRVSAGWQSQARSGLGRSNGSGTPAAGS